MIVSKRARVCEGLPISPGNHKRPPVWILGQPPFQLFKLNVFTGYTMHKQEVYCRSQKYLTFVKLKTACMPDPLISHTSFKEINKHDAKERFGQDRMR